MARWRFGAAAYLAAVATSTVMNLASNGGASWYVASMILTLPWSLMAIYPILWLAGLVASATGGEYVEGNAYSDAAIVLAYLAMAVSNVALARFVVASAIARRQSR